MSDPFETGLDEDPAADFLAREQQELAGLEDDGFGGLTADSTSAAEVNQENPVAVAPEDDGLDLFGVSGEPAVVSDTNISVPVQDVVFGDTDFGGTDFGESGGSLDPLASTPPPLTASLDALVAAPASTASLDALVAAPAPPAPPAPPVGLSDDPTEDLLDPLAVAAPSPAAVVAAPSQAAVVAAPSQAAYVDLDEDLLDSFAAVRVADEVNGDDSPPESEVAPTQNTLQWREEQLKKIAEKDKNEEAKLEEWRNTAKRELEEWYARQAEQVEKHKKNNRVAEAEFVKERDETTPGNEWERISRLCDFNPKNNKNTKDVSKLRSLLLQLKQNPLARSTTTTTTAAT